jgi:RNA polymerase-binding transcription factor DksA
MIITSPEGDTMSSPLTAGQQALLKADLEQRRDALGRQLSEHLHGQSRTDRAREVLQQDGDDAPQRLPERDIAAALTAHEQRELDAVTAALQRLQRGEYGGCADCGVAIPFDRLKAEPWALRCIDCESRREKAVR